jgi:hypothetical protein
MSMPKLARMFRFWVFQPSEFGNYCGLRRQHEFVKEIAAILDTLDSDSFMALMDSLRCYYSNINVWVYQIMPWGVGYAFPRKDKQYYEKGLSLIAGK